MSPNLQEIRKVLKLIVLLKGERTKTHSARHNVVQLKLATFKICKKTKLVMWIVEAGWSSLYGDGMSEMT